MAIKLNSTKPKKPKGGFIERFKNVCQGMELDPDKMIILSFVKSVTDGQLGIVMNEPGDQGEAFNVDRVGEELAKLIYSINQGALAKSMFEAMLQFAQMPGDRQEVFAKAAQMYELLQHKADNTPYMDPSDTFRIHH